MFSNVSAYKNGRNFLRFFTASFFRLNRTQKQKAFISERKI